MKKLLLHFFFIFLLLPNVFSQSLDIFKNEDKLIAELKKDKYDIDSNAQAVILSRSITAHMVSRKVSREYKEETYEYSVDFTAKILSDEAANELSLINIPRYFHTSIANISGQTYNLDGNSVVKQDLAHQEILKDNLTDGIDIIKFNLPAVKKGSIIHYTYKTIQPNFLNIPDQYLQLEYPILSETYELIYPSYLDCKGIERINVTLKQVTSSNDLNNCEACVLKENYTNEAGFYYKWSRHNVPAFKKEPLMGSEENYKERIRMQIEAVTINGSSLTYLDNWNDYSRQFLYENQNFIGQVFKGNAFLGDKVKELTAGKQTDLEKARAIYAFVRDSFNVKYVDKDFSLRSVFSDKTGSEKEINLLLIAMLKRANFKCTPMLLNPKPYEKLNAIFPDNNIKAIIADLKIDNKDIYLDASKHQLPFGVILPEDYNGYARLVDEIGNGITLNPNSITEKTTTIASIKPSEKVNQLKLNLDIKMGVFDAYNFRKKMANDTGEIRKMYIKDMQATNSGFSITKLNFDNLNKPDDALKIHIEADLDLSDNTTIYLNPFFVKLIEKNPFTSTQRTNAIEMNNLENKTYVLSLQLPKEYAVDDYPKSTKYKLNEAGDMQLENLYSSDTANNILNIKSSFSTNECHYQSEQYGMLKAFYDKCVEYQSQSIVIKKIAAK